jgi:hypothetical protein
MPTIYNSLFVIYECGFAKGCFQSQIENRKSKITLMLHRRYLYHISRRDFKEKFGLLQEISANRELGRFPTEMPKEGVEPSPCCQDGILNPARLPVPPLRLLDSMLLPRKTPVKQKFSPAFSGVGL